MIVIEGPDNSGKTTLSKRLSKDLGIPFRHSIRPKTVEELENSFIDKISNPNAIYDRYSPICEYVYGNILRGVSLAGNNLFTISRELNFMQPFVIYCRPPDGIIKNSKKPEMEGVLENIEKIIKKYDEFFNYYSSCNPHTGCIFYRYDWTKNTYNHLLSLVKVHLIYFKIGEK